MKRILFITVLTLTTSSLALGQTTGQQTGQGHTSGVVSTASQQSNVEQELIAFDKEIDAARRRGDKAFFERILTDDFIRVTGSGSVQNRAQYLEAIKPVPSNTAPASAASAQPPKYIVRVYGDTAVMVHGSQAQVMHVFVKQQGRWKMAAWQVTPVAPQQPAQKQP